MKIYSLIIYNLLALLIYVLLTLAFLWNNNDSLFATIMLFVIAFVTLIWNLVINYKFKFRFSKDYLIKKKSKDRHIYTIIMLLIIMLLTFLNFKFEVLSDIHENHYFVIIFIILMIVETVMLIIEFLNPFYGKS